MNPSATTFFRACRARPAATAAPSRSFVLRSLSTSTSASTHARTPLRAAASATATRNTTQYQGQCQCRRPVEQQRAAFSSRCTLSQAQPVDDIPATTTTTTTTSTSTISQTTTAAAATAAAAQPSSHNTSPSSPSSSSPSAPASESDAASVAAADAAFLATSYKLTGHVTRVGTMRKTVRVSRKVQVWDKFLRKHWRKTTHDLVHDPLNILNEGDVITYGPFPPSMQAAREARGQVGGKTQVRFVLRDVVTPFGSPVEQRVGRFVGSPEGRWRGTPGQMPVQKVVQRTSGKDKERADGSSLKKNVASAAQATAA